MTGPERERHYRLGPLEHRGLVAGWRPGQVISAGVACTLAAVVLSISTAMGAALGAISLVVLGLCVATVPVAGRTIDEWVPSLVAHVRRRGTRTMLRLEVVDAELLGGREGVGVALQPTGSISVTMALESTGISLLDPNRRDQRVAGLIAALGALAREGSVVDRIGWSASCVVDWGAELSADLRRRGAGGEEAAIEMYRTLLADVASQGLSRRVHLTLRTSPGVRRPGGAIEALLAEAALVSQALEDAGHRPCRLLSATDLADAIATELGGEVTAETDPGGRAGAKTAMSPHRPTAVGCRFLVVASGTARLGSIETAGRHTATWWVAQWPRTEVTAELLAPVLLGHEGHSMSVVIEPVPPSIAMRRAASARTSGAADTEIRRRGGFLSDRRRDAEAAHLETREAELVDGHGSLRFAGFLATSAHSAEALAERAAETELAAAQSRLEVRRLVGDHGRGLLATLPLAMGLP